MNDTQSILFVDTETRSSLDLKIVGTVKYAASAQMVLGGFLLGDKYDIYDLYHDLPIPKWAIDHIESGGLVCAHNYLFDYLILSKYVPALTLEQGIDTIAMAATHALPKSLENLGEALLTSNKKLTTGTRLINLFSKPNKDGEFNDGRMYPEQWGQFREYLERDVQAMKAVYEVLPPLTKFQRQTWLDTQIVNMTGIPIDINMVQTIQKHIEPLVDQESTKFIRMTGLFPSRRNDVLKWVQENGCAIEDLQAKTVEEAIAKPSTPAIVRDALEVRANLGHASYKKYDTMLAATMDDNHIYGCFAYHQASTGRWGGRLLQPHNLTKGKIDGQEAVERIQNGEFSVELIKSAVRPMIYCKEGFTIADYSGIEARIVQWLAKDEDALDVFRNGLDPYKWMAQKIYTAGYEDITDLQRFVGKQAILGLGFSMSWFKYQKTVAGYGVELSMTECKRAVSVYRETHKKLVKLWNDFMLNFIRANQCPGRYIEVNEYIKFIKLDLWMYMELPSGRRLAYYNPKVQFNEIEFLTEGANGRLVTEHTYGGKLVENAVQAISADILALAINRLLKRGYKVPMHVHDEIVVRNNIGVDNLISIMCELPPWAKGLPLTASGEVTERFVKL